MSDLDPLDDVKYNDEDVKSRQRPRLSITTSSLPVSDDVMYESIEDDDDYNVSNAQDVYDLMPADEKITWTLYPFYHDEKDADLMPSGLLGPVKLVTSEAIKL